MAIIALAIVICGRLTVVAVLLFELRIVPSSRLHLRLGTCLGIGGRPLPHGAVASTAVGLHP
eukprot:4617022-Pyramimonas_sp.AAC.1